MPTEDEYRLEPRSFSSIPSFGYSGPSPASPPSHMRQEMCENDAQFGENDRAMNESGHAIQKLLGHDLDTYLDAHVEAYEVAKRKWTECSMDEWTKGADG